MRIIILTLNFSSALPTRATTCVGQTKIDRQTSRKLLQPSAGSPKRPARTDNGGSAAPDEPRAGGQTMAAQTGASPIEASAGGQLEANDKQEGEHRRADNEAVGQQATAKGTNHSPSATAPLVVGELKCESGPRVELELEEIINSPVNLSAPPHAHHCERVAMLEWAKSPSEVELRCRANEQAGSGEEKSATTGPEQVTVKGRAGAKASAEVEQGGRLRMSGEEEEEEAAKSGLEGKEIIVGASSSPIKSDSAIRVLDIGQDNTTSRSIGSSSSIKMEQQVCDERPTDETSPLDGRTPSRNSARSEPRQERRSDEGELSFCMMS